MRDTPLTKAFSLLLGPTSKLASAFQANDKWWRIPSEDVSMKTEIDDVLKDFESYAEKWFTLNRRFDAMEAEWKLEKSRLERAGLR